MKKFIGVFLSFCFLFLSCSPAPQPIGHKFSRQKKIEAAHHWEVLANDFAKQVVTTIEQDSALLLKTTGAGHTFENNSDKQANFSLGSSYIYIQTNDRSSFGKAFRNYLITELTNKGYMISYSPEEALTLRWSVNKISHNANRASSFEPGTFTTGSMLGYGIYKILDRSSSFGSLFVTGIALDLAVGLGEQVIPKEVPHTEIVLTLSLSKKGYLFSRQSGTYYVNSEDTWHYNNIPDFAGQEEILLPTKSYKVVNY